MVIIHKLEIIGALTSKPYAFTSRSWELEKNESVDIFDSMGSNLVVNFKGLKIVRVLPSVNEFLNQEWITNKARFSFEGLYKWRFTVPMVKDGNSFSPIGWSDAFQLISEKLKKSRETQFFCGDLDRISLSAYKEFVNQNFGVDLLNADVNTLLPKSNIVNNRALPFENYKEISLEKAVVLVNLNIRFEQPLMNVFFRNYKIKVYNVGSVFNFNYNHSSLGNNADTLLSTVKGKHLSCQFLVKCAKASKKNKVKFFFGSDLFLRNDGFQVERAIEEINFLQKGLVYKTLYQSTKVFSNLFSNIYKARYKNSKASGIFRYVAGNVSPQSLTKNYASKNQFLVFQGTHNKEDLSDIDLILPPSNHYEGTSIFNNNLSYKQETFKIIQSPKISRPHWQIFKALSDFLINKGYSNRKLAFNDINEVKNLSTKVFNCDSNLTNNKAQFLNNILFKKIARTNKKILNKIYKSNFKRLNFTYYNSDIISRSSKTMLESHRAFDTNNNNFYYD